jgi:hypothetical protein
VSRRFLRYHRTQDDIWSHIELDDDGWARRQVDLRGPRQAPAAAASLAAVLHICDGQDLAAMRTCEAQYGVLSEGGWDGWLQDTPPSEITETDFEALRSAARKALSRSHRSSP